MIKNQRSNLESSQDTFILLKLIIRSIEASLRLLKISLLI